MFKFVSDIVRLGGRALQPVVNFRQFHALPTTTCSNEIAAPVVANSWSLTSIRTKTIITFTRASEYKRLKVHGWRVRFKTKGGRKTIMRRILKGRFYLAH